MQPTVRMKIEPKTGRRVFWVACPVCKNRLAAVEGFTEGEPITEEGFQKTLAVHIRREHPGSPEAAKLG